MVSSKNPSLKTLQEVYRRWKGKCAFCGISLPLDEHHIIVKKDDPSLIDDPNNLILLCENHHGLTLKKKPSGTPVITFEDIQDLEKSTFARAKKKGFYFEMPPNFWVNFGSNLCCECPYVLVVNGKPLIEIWSQKPAWYANEPILCLYMRFFDENNNFVGGMFANHWASVINEEWKFDYDNTGYNYEMIGVKNRKKPLFVKFERYADVVYITGRFYFDGIKISVNSDCLILPRGTICAGNIIQGSEVAFKIQGNNESASLFIGGRLN